MNYNFGMLRTVGRMRNDKKSDQEIINELCRLYGFGAKTATDIINHYDNIKEA